MGGLSEDVPSAKWYSLAPESPFNWCDTAGYVRFSADGLYAYVQGRFKGDVIEVCIPDFEQALAEFRKGKEAGDAV